MFKSFLESFINGVIRRFALTVRIDDSENGRKGWRNVNGGRSLERASYELDELYTDAIEAWRKNPKAWRIVSLISDYILGDGITISSPVPSLNDYIQRFWFHPLNMLDQQLEPMSNEFAFAGDVFVLLFRNPVDGMSYVRFLVKNEIDHIETAKNDRELELIYWQKNGMDEPIPWYSPYHPDAPSKDAICLHYRVNKIIGSLWGEGDLSPILPWLLRYSRMLEGRVKLHWALRAFIWLLRVPKQDVKAKAEENLLPPEPGSVKVVSSDEEWTAVAPDLKGGDAKHDLTAIKQMIDVGSGFPPHWQGETENTSLASARMAEGPTERRLRRRQLYFVWMLEDILLNAYQRAAQIGRVDTVAEWDYRKLFTVVIPDISRGDNEELSRAATQMARAMETLGKQMPSKSGEKFLRLVLRMVLRSAGETPTDERLNELIAEMGLSAIPAVDGLFSLSRSGKEVQIHE